VRYLAGESRTNLAGGNALGESRWGLAGLCSQPGPHKMVEVASARLASRGPSPSRSRGRLRRRFTAHVSHAAHASWNWRWALQRNFCGAGSPLDSPPMTQASPAGALTVRGSERRNYEW
jgi:hypothetical protein